MSRVKIEDGGRICLPPSVCQQLLLAEGDTLVVLVEDGEIRLLTGPAAVRRAQSLVRKYVPEGVSLVDELLEERQREARREWHEAERDS